MKQFLKIDRLWIKKAFTLPSRAMIISKYSICLVLVTLFMLPSVVSATTIKVDKRTLEERVSDADLIFIGKVINKQVSGDWATAELLVEEPITGVKKGDKVKVTWRIQVNGHHIYDTEEGLRGLSMLKNTNKHKGRFWFKGVKDIKLKDEVIAAKKSIEKKKLILKEHLESIDK